MKEYNLYRITSSSDPPPSWKRMKRVDCRWHSKTLLLDGLKSSSKHNSCRGLYVGKKHIRTIVVTFGLLGCLFLLDSLVIAFFESPNPQPTTASNNSSGFQVQVLNPMFVISTLLEFISPYHFLLAICLYIYSINHSRVRM